MARLEQQHRQIVDRLTGIDNRLGGLDHRMSSLEPRVQNIEDRQTGLLNYVTSEQARDKQSLQDANDLSRDRRQGFYSMIGLIASGMFLAAIVAIWHFLIAPWAEIPKITPKP
jgi:hypothetical protein